MNLFSIMNRYRSLRLALAFAQLAALILACGTPEPDEIAPSPDPVAEPVAEPTAPSRTYTLATAQLAPGDLASGCTLSPEAHGSIHAETMFQVGVEEPSGGKNRQGFTCDGEDIAVFFYDYGSASQAHAASDWMGAQLWGTTDGPSAHNPDELLRNDALIAVVSSPRPAPIVEALRAHRGFAPARTLAAPVRTAPTEDLSAARLDEFRSRVDCTAQASFCAAIDAFRTGTPTPLPTAPTSHIGHALLLTGAVPSVVYAVLEPSGFMDGAVTPDTPEEATQLVTTLEQLRAGATPPASDPVVSFVSSLANGQQAVHDTTVIGSSRTYVLEDRRIYYRSTADGIVVLDVNPEGLLRASIYRN